MLLHPLRLTISHTFVLPVCIILQKFHIPSVTALVRKDYKYVYWPQHDYEQLFHMPTDPDEIHDLANSTLESTMEAMQMMKARFKFAREWAEAGNPV
jgi:arylsulfatase